MLKTFALLFAKQYLHLMTQGKSFFVNIVAKRENAGNQNFLLVQQCLHYQGGSG